MKVKLLPNDIHDILSSSGLPWHVETGTRHYKVILNNKFAAILPKSPHARGQDGFARRNVLAALRRAIRNHQRP